MIVTVMENFKAPRQPVGPQHDLVVLDGRTGEPEMVLVVEKSRPRQILASQLARFDNDGTQCICLGISEPGGQRSADSIVILDRNGKERRRVTVPAIPPQTVDRIGSAPYRWARSGWRNLDVANCCFPAPTIGKPGASRIIP